MIQKIIAFSLILIPLICWHNFGEGVRSPKEIASVLCLAVVAGAASIKRRPLNRWFFVFFAWCTATLLLSNYTFPLVLKGGVVNVPSNLIAYKSLFYIALVILAIQGISSIDIDLKKISKIISIVCIVMCAYSFLQFAGMDEWFKVADPNTGWVGKSIWSNDLSTVNILNEDKTSVGHFSRRIVGTVGNPSILGIFLAMCLPYTIYHGKKWGITATILSLIVIALTISITAYAATTISLLFILFFKKKRLTTLLTILLILFTIFVYYKVPKVKFMFNPTGRIEVLKKSFKILNTKAITGYGLGSWEYIIGHNPEIVKSLNKQNWKEAHFEPWQLWFETGLVGVGLISIAIFSLFWLFLKNISRESVYLMASLVVFLVVSMTYFPMRIAPLSYYGVITLGLLTNKIGV